MFFRSGGRNESNSQKLARIGEKKIFHQLDVHHVKKVGIKRFLGSGGRSECNNHQLARIGEKKIFHQLDVHYVKKVGIKRFLGSGGRDESNSQNFARIGDKKIFHQLDVNHVQKVRIKRIWPQEAEMSLTPSARPNRREENFSSTRRTSGLESRNQSFLGSGGQNKSNNHQLAPIGEKKIFHAHDVHLVQKVGIKRFWAREAGKESNSQKFARIIEKKIFHQHDVYHVKKVKIKRFLAQEVEMSLTTISSLESMRRKFFINATYIMSRT